MSYVFEEYVNELKAEGRREGQCELLADWAAQRFGEDVVERLLKALSRASSTRQMADAGDLILRCETAEELFDRLALAGESCSAQPLSPAPLAR